MRASTLIFALSALLLVASAAACEPDYYGDGADCSCYQPSKTNETDNPLQLDLTLTKFNGDRLTIVYHEAFKYFDADPQLHSSQCYNAFNWTVESDGAGSCTRRHVGVINWSDAYKKDSPLTDCGVARSVATNGTITFTFDFAVLNREKLPALRNVYKNRTLIHKMPFSIIFPIEVTATSGPVDVFAPVLLIASVTKQAVVGTVPNASPLKAHAEVLSSLQWPFKLISPVLAVYPSSKVSGADGAAITNIETDGCPETTTNSVCYQRWSFDATANNVAVCDFTGNYRLDFHVACRDGRSGNCPLDSATDTATIAFTLTTSNHCPEVADEIGLTIAIGTFQDAAFTFAKTAFLDTQTVYVRVPVASSKASLTVASIYSAIYTVNSVQFTLVSGGAVSTVDGSPGKAFSVAIHDGAAVSFGVQSVPWFSFVIHSTALGLGQDEIKSSTLKVVVKVQYANAGQTSVAASSVEEETEYVTVQASVGTQSASATTTFDVNGKSSTTSSSASSSSGKVFGLSQAKAGAAIVGGVALVALVVVGTIAIRYRRRERMIEEAVSSRMTAIETSSEASLVQ